MTAFIWVAIIIVILSLGFLLVRVFLGPSIPDRLIALDGVGVMLISAIALFTVLFDTGFFIEVILLIAIMSFIGTISFSKFIEKGEIIQHDRNR